MCELQSERLLFLTISNFRLWPGVRIQHLATKLSLEETIRMTNGGSLVGIRTLTPGQEQTITRLERETFKGPLHSKTYRTIYGRSSA